MYTHVQAACGRQGSSNEQAGLDKSTHPYPSSKHQKFSIHGYKTVTIKSKEGDHTSRLLPSSFRYVQVRNIQRPYSHNIGHDVNELGHQKANADDGLLQC